MEEKEIIDDYIFDNEQWKESEIICPYCKHKHENEDAETLYKERDSEEFECENCGKKFYLTSSFDWWYTTTPITSEIDDKLLDEYK